MKKNRYLLFLFIFLTVSVTLAQSLENENLLVEFTETGIGSIYDKHLKETISLTDEEWRIDIEQLTFGSKTLQVAEKESGSHSVTYKYKSGSYEFKVVYELKKSWRFISKQLFISNGHDDEFRINSVDVLKAKLQNSFSDIYVAGLSATIRKNHGLGDYGAFVRMNEKWGGMFLVQNPFFHWKIDGGKFSMTYEPDMLWKREYGDFASDRAFIGTYRLTGNMLAGDIEHHGKWLLKPEWGNPERRVDEGEVQSFIECVRAFLLYNPEKSERIHVPWCENDYQIDIATEYGEEQFKRIVNMSSILGIGHMLYTVRNTDIALSSEATDSWGWEHLLWLNMGPQIRRNEWDPKNDPLPGKTKEMIQYARDRNVNLMAYVYPTLEFQEDTSWLKQRWSHSPQKGASFEHRGFQDWFLENLLAMKEKAGLSGFAFDYWSMNIGSSNLYAQWFGGRRVLEELRKQAPDIIIDGRQSYHNYGPWTWLAGTYPHPTGGDEQPESFESFPDLHFDRSSANQQRITSYWYRNVQFCPPELMPGFITHQTARRDSTGHAPRESDLNLRDWDYLGWKYSLMSSIATAPFAHCVDMIPARDQREYELFMKDTESQEFIKYWFNWTDENAAILRNIRSIIGAPKIGRADGTAAIDEDHGFVFLFNPNHRKVSAEFVLDESIGLTKGNSFLIRQLFPQKGMLMGAKDNGSYQFGDTFKELMDGTSAIVLKIQPLNGVEKPILLNAQGRVKCEAGQLILEGVKGEFGTVKQVQVMLSEGVEVHKVRVNGVRKGFVRRGKVILVDCHFAGEYFGHSQSLWEYDPHFNGKHVQSSFKIPKRIFDQLAERKKKWKIDWTEEDLICTWLAPERLLLYVQLAEPDWKMDVLMKINGKSVDVKKAYSSRTPGMLKQGKGHNTFTGFYVDVSGLEPDVNYQVEVVLPDNLKPGQFQGLFFENIETEYTSRLKD